MNNLKELRRNAQDCLTQVRSATNADDKVLLPIPAEAARRSWMKPPTHSEMISPTVPR